MGRGPGAWLIGTEDTASQVLSGGAATWGTARWGSGYRQPVMCGIAGIVRITPASPAEAARAARARPPAEAIPEAWLDLLDESIRHRGPDGCGRFRDRAVRA